jgi:VanZ family protein
MTRLRYWLPVVAWAALISFLSTDSFSSEHTGTIVLVVLRWFLPHASDATLELLHLLIRKCAHLTEYFIFSLLLLRAIRGTERGWRLRWALLALAIAAGYAGLDEFHQSFVPSRTSSARDALLDATGAATAQLAAWIAMQRRGGRKS